MRRLLRYDENEDRSFCFMKTNSPLCALMPALALMQALSAPPSPAEGEIGFIERFALAPDRAAVLKELIPGTEDFYYFSSLHAQHQGRFGAVGAFLEPWRTRFGETPRYLEIRNRQALLEYSENPAKTLEFLTRELGLSFHHQQDKLDAKPDFPTRLDPAAVAPEAFLKKALSRGNLSGVSDLGLDALLRNSVELTPLQRRELLSRLRHPDHESLVGLIVANLREKESQGFGEFEIHRRLTLTQLDELAGLRPELAHDPRFVEQRLLRLRPGGDELIHRNPEAERAWNDRVWNDVRTLPPAFATMKAAVLHRRLELARARGEFPAEDFLEYLRLPRPFPYMRPDYLREQQRAGVVVDPAVDHGPVLGIPPIHSDEGLVRSYLEHFFLTEESTARFSPYLDGPWLDRVFAETKLLHGLGDAAQWFARLGPAQVQALKDRVEIEWAPTNPEHFAAADEVALTATLKNVPELIVKVYEINAFNFYRDRLEEINTDIDLDGLVANEETRHRFDEAPVRRRTETFRFDSLKGKRGVWVVEMIGNGISSRALVRKGGLQALSVTTAAGEVLTVLDESNQAVPGAAAYLGGKRYEADNEGHILLPFSKSGAASVILSDGASASLATIDLPREEYQLDAGFLLEQETLLPGAEALVAVRPRLSLNGEPISFSRLRKTRLVVTTTDLDGIESSSEATDFALFDDRESTHRFRVPPRLRTVEVTLSGEIEPLSEAAEPIALSASRSFEVNGIEALEVAGDAHLVRLEKRHLVQVLGRSGEPKPDHPVHFQFRHAAFTEALEADLKTDAAGGIDLGDLPGIVLIQCQPAGLTARNWILPDDRIARPEAIHARRGEPIEIALPLDAVGGRDSLALLETRDGVPVADAFAAAVFERGVLRLNGLAAGDYELYLKEEGRHIDLKVTDSDTVRLGHALSRDRHLRLPRSQALRLVGTEVKGGQLTLTLANVDPSTRVHVVATRFLPTFDPDEGLTIPDRSRLFEIERGAHPTRYVSGRDIGEEYRYILERRHAKKFPGNLLARPGLLLNPWELNETATEVKEASKGEAHAKSAPASESQRHSVEMASPRDALAGDGRALDQSPSLNFLANSAVVLTNLHPGEGGLVSIDLADLGDRHHVHFVAMNRTETLSHSLALPEPKGGAVIRDLRLDAPLDAAKHFTQRRKTTVLDGGQSLTVSDFRASEIQAYGTLGDVHRTLSAINGDPALAEFAFVTTWPSLDEAAKRALYSEHACHELNFFLSQKDPDFFAAVVRPYLANKREKTFLDHYLLEAALESYLAPWEYGRLNIVERILLARRIGGEERSRTASHVTHLHDLIPPDPETDAMFFRSALRGRSADASAGIPVGFEGFGFEGGAGGAVRGPLAGRTLVSRGIPPQTAVGAGAAAAAAATPEESALPAPAPMSVSGFVTAEVEGALLARAKQQTLYQTLDSTKELAENNYHHLPIESQNADLVTANRFWRDYANWDGRGGFHSPEFPAATANFTEMMFVLSVLDLPFAEKEHDFDVTENVFKLTAASPLIVFHEEIEEAALAEGATPLLASQNFLRADDRQREEDGQMVDKFVTGEFLSGVIYASQVVVTNPTSSFHRLEILVQIPEGAVPVAGSDYTQSHPLDLPAFNTQRIETLFYFPSPSAPDGFALYPVQVAKNEEVVVAGEARKLRVVAALADLDEASWDYLSQFGTTKQVLDYLEGNNLQRIDLSRIAWRAREDVDFLRRATALIASRHAFDATLWSYGIHHNDSAIAREFLKHREDFLVSCGMVLESDLARIDPVDRRWHQHLDYAPLVNARHHRLGREHRILNDRFFEQYHEFLDVLAHKPTLGAEDKLGLAAYLSLQDRIEEAMAWLDAVPREETASQVQYDYLKAYHAFHRQDLTSAKALAAEYADYPVDKWRRTFAEVAKQVTAVEGAASAPDKDTREGRLEDLSAREPFLDLSATGREIHLSHRNLKDVTVNYYEMDLEFLFSSRPFVSAGDGGFSYIRPNLVETKELPADASEFVFSVPEAFASKNVLVEVSGGGKVSSIPVYSNRLDLRLSEGSGRIDLRHRETGKPLARAYVKVYARMKDGTTRFFKDGYTDLRGVFDYTSLSTDDLDRVERLSLLVMSEADGSVVREAKPPQR